MEHNLEFKKEDVYLQLQIFDSDNVSIYHDGTIEVNGVLTTDNDLIVETLKSIVKKQNQL